MYGRATITLGIGPYSSCYYFCVCVNIFVYVCTKDLVLIL